jgi:hypothetical protein
MHKNRAIVIIIALILLGTCLWFVPRKDRKITEWSVGYWIWGDWHRDASSSGPASTADLIVFDMGELKNIHHSANAPENQPVYRFRAIEPEHLPAARRYAAVVRLNAAPFSKKDAVTPVLKRFRRLQYRFQECHRNLNEIQLDFDCPTGSLSQYGNWLEQWKRTIPSGTRLTITALLDWFNPGTAIGHVLTNVDGFVPQFYDVDPEAYEKTPSITSLPDQKKWGPIFEQYNVPYQIGLSAFGRIQFIKQNRNDWYFSHEDPYNLLSHATGKMQFTINPSRERVIKIDLHKEFTYDPPDAESPARCIIIQPTSESILRSYQEARAMGPHCAGVLFFRWPSTSESLVLRPDEITGILSGKAPDNSYSLESLDGECASVDCSDISLVQKNRFPSSTRTITVESSAPLEYFLPGRFIRSTIINARTMQFQMPSYNAAAKIYLGRAVSKQPVNFTLRMLP